MHKLDVVIVEDECIVARDLQKLLETLGHSVSACAGSAEEALQKIGLARPDLVLMDIYLRGGLDGIELSKVIRERYNLPVIYLSAYADKETTARALQTRPFGYLVKPFEPIEVRLAIEMALARLELERRLQPDRVESRPQWLPLTRRRIPPQPQRSKRPRSVYERGRAIPLAPESVWQVHEGLVKLSTVHSSGEEALVGLAGPNRVFGFSLTSLTVYQATALSRVELVCFDLRELAASTALATELRPWIEGGIRQTEQRYYFRSSARNWPAIACADCCCSSAKKSVGRSKRVSSWTSPSPIKNWPWPLASSERRSRCPWAASGEQA